MTRAEPVGIFAHKKCNRRDPRRNHAPTVLAPVLIASRRLKRRGMRREAAPSDHARQAQLIEVRGIVVGDSARQHKALPRACRNFEALQLTNYFERSMLAAHLRARS